MLYKMADSSVRVIIFFVGLTVLRFHVIAQNTTTPGNPIAANDPLLALLSASQSKLNATSAAASADLAQTTTATSTTSTTASTSASTLAPVAPAASPQMGGNLTVGANTTKESTAISNLTIVAAVTDGTGNASITAPQTNATTPASPSATANATSVGTTASSASTPINTSSLAPSASTTTPALTTSPISSVMNEVTNISSASQPERSSRILEPSNNQTTRKIAAAVTITKKLSAKPAAPSLKTEKSANTVTVLPKKEVPSTIRPVVVERIVTQAVVNDGSFHQVQGIQTKALDFWKNTMEMNVQQPSVFDALDALRGKERIRNDEIVDMLRNAVADVDYPVYSTIPETTFQCETVKQPGFYADKQTRCQVIRRCDMQGLLWSYLCPNMTVFNQITLICDWYYNVDCQKSEQFYEYSNRRLYTNPEWRLLTDPVAL